MCAAVAEAFIGALNAAAPAPSPSAQQVQQYVDLLRLVQEVEMGADFAPRKCENQLKELRGAAAPFAGHAGLKAAQEQGASRAAAASAVAGAHGGPGQGPPPGPRQ
eukprot:5302546-Lingulodinium_polyedra.AAC.1